MTTALAYSGIDITPLTQNPGLIYENIAQLRISATSWKIFNRINLLPLKGTAPALRHAINVTESYCKNPCTNEVEFTELYGKLENIAEQLYQLLKTFKRNNDTREKRDAVFPFMGKIQKILFGTLDQEDGIFLQEIAEKSYNTSQQTAELVLNLTQVVDIKFSNIQNNLENITDQISDLDSRLDKIEYEHRMANIIAKLWTAVIEFENEVNILLEAILWSHSGELHSRFMPFQQLEKSMELIQNARIGAEFPLQNHEFSLEEIVKISKTMVYISNDQLIYALFVPLLEYYHLYLYKLYPLPTKQNIGNIEVFAYIYPESKYVAIDRNNQSYISLDYENLSNCKHVRDIYICKNLNPLMEINPSSACEIRIITQNEIDMKSCNVKIKKLKQSHWIKLVQENGWGFSTINNESIYVSCEQDSPVSYRLPSSGILKLEAGCIGKTVNAVFKATKEVKVETKVEVFTKTFISLNKMINETQTILYDKIYNLINETTNIYNNSGTESLDTGIDFKYIIQRAKTLSEYDYIQKRTIIHTDNKFLIITVTIFISILIWTILSAYCLECRGTNRFRQVSDTVAARQPDVIRMSTAVRDIMPQSSPITNQPQEISRISHEAYPATKEILIFPRDNRVTYIKQNPTPGTSKRSEILTPTWHFP